MSIPALSLLALLVGCAAEAEPALAPATEVAPTEAPVAQAAVHHVVFVGQAEACDCTKERVAASWMALEAVITDRALPVERLDVHGDAERVEDLQSLQGFVATPAVYFLAEDGSLVELLQGGLTVEMIREVTG